MTNSHRQVTVAAGALAFLVAPCAARADGMTVTELLSRAGDGNLGATAFVNPRTRPVLNELMSAGKALKAAEERRKAEGKGPSFCPQKGSSMGLPQLITALRALPPAEQGQPVRTALPAVMRARYPCPAR